MKPEDVILQNVDSLPAFPNTAIKLMEIVHAPNPSVDEMVEVLKYDQAVTAQLLKVCNSAYFGMSSAVDSLLDATMTLGTLRLLQIVMAMQSSEVFTVKDDMVQRVYGLNSDSIWLKSVGCAVINSNIANHLNLDSSGSYFTAGLLHDIGKLLMSSCFYEQYNQIIKQHQFKDDVELLNLEKEVIGVSHTKAGSIIASEWNIPENICKAIEFCKTPELLEEIDPLVEISCIAEHICRDFESELDYDSIDSAINKYNLNANILEDIRMKTIDEINYIAKLLS